MCEPTGGATRDMADLFDSKVLTASQHYVHATDPYQLVHLLCALEACGIDLAECTAFDKDWSTERSKLREPLQQIYSRLGIETINPDTMPLPTTSSHLMKIVLGRDRAQEKGRKRVLWFSKQVGFSVNAHDLIQRINPHVVHEFYNGYRSPVVWKTKNKTPMSVTDASPAWQRMIHNLKAKPAQSDLYFAPEPHLEVDYVESEHRARTVPLSVLNIRDKFRMVGDLLETILRPTFPKGPKPHVIVLATFSRVLYKAQPGQWQHYYDRMLKAVRKTLPKGVIWVKTHPRTPPDHKAFLNTLCSKHGADLWVGNQFVQHSLEKWNAKRIAVIGAPCSPLVDVCTLGYGAAFCPTLDLMGYYFGDEVTRHFYYREDHDCMKAYGVKRFADPEILRKRLAKFLKGEKDG